MKKLVLFLISLMSISCTHKYNYTCIERTLTSETDTTITYPYVGTSSDIEQVEILGTQEWKCYSKSTKCSKN